MVDLVRVLLAMVGKILANMLLILSIFIPKEKGLVVFSMSRGRYWGNSRALFEYMVENPSPNIRVAWLADPGLPANKVPDKYVTHFCSRNSARGWFLCARAQAVVISHGFGDFGLLREIAKRKKVLMLWHAITTKYCGLLDEKFDEDMSNSYRKRETVFYDCLTVSSDVDRYYSASYTGMDVNDVIVTGLPRNDRLFRESTGDKQKNEWSTFLYSPTFRDYPVEGGSVFFPFPHDIVEVAAWCHRTGTRFFLRPHPNDQGSVAHVLELNAADPEVFLDAGVEKNPDVMDLIISSDGIITDYSSTYIDGLVLDLPVIFIDFDRDRYVKTRGLAYDYDLITPGPKVCCWADFMSACEGMIRGADEWSARREFVRQIFFKYRDGNACERVSALIKDRLLR